MSTTAVAPAPSLRNDVAACRRHLVTQLHLTTRDPFALGLLAFAGAATVLLWNYGLGIHPVWACRYPWPGGPVVYNGPAPTAVQLAFYRPSGLLVLTQVLWATLVAWASGRRPVQGRRPAALAHPSLPIGLRARAVAEVLVAVSLTMAARAVVLSLGGVRLGRMLFGHNPSLALFPAVAWLSRLAPPAEPALALAAYASAFAVSTLLGALLVGPLVLAWSTTRRLDGRGLLRPGVATLLLFGALSVGAMAHLMSAIPVAALVSGLLLVRPDDGDRQAMPRAARVLRHRPSPGPVAQLRRDAWLGLLERRWLFLALALALPLVPTLAYRANLLGYASAGGPLVGRALAALLALLQWLVLMAVPFLPFGLALVPGAPRAALFSGAFLRSWSALPVPRQMVVRIVYVHALLAGALAWLALCAQVKLLGTRLGPLFYVLPAAFLVASLVVCEAVGDRRRGLLAVGALIGFQFGVPLAYAGLDVLGHLPAFLREREGARLVAYAVALVGILPPLVHLRARAASPSVSRG